jgi:hypothetical protein
MTKQHDYITVLRRRWCRNCNTFQTWNGRRWCDDPLLIGSWPWGYDTTKAECPNNRGTELTLARMADHPPDLRET